MQDSAPPPIDVSVLICTHNRGALLGRTLASVDAIRPVPGAAMEVVVIANACTDDTPALAAAWAEASPWPACVIEEPRPGLSIARNRAIEESTGAICAYLDDDVRVDPSWLEAVVRVAAEPDAGFGGGKVKLWWEEVQRPAWFTRRLDSILSENDLGDQAVELRGTTGLVGANFWVRREVFDQIGRFREDLGRSGKSLVGGEESDLVERALAAGFTGRYCPDAVLEHWVPAARVTREYLTRVSVGNEYGRVRMKPRMSPVEWTRCLLGHAKLWAVHRTLAAVRGITRGREQATHDASRAALGYGGLKALWDRCFRG